MIEMMKTFGILLFVVMPTLINSLANCPNGCDCNDETLVVTCNETNLDVMPIALNPSIRKLIMQKNKIKSIESSIQFYPDLELFDLSENHLLKLLSRTFQYQKKLTELNLGQNKISHIETDTFYGLEMLQILNLRGNLIDELNDNAFSSLSVLEELNLGQNRIAQIGMDAFYRLYNLKILYLDDNSLIQVPSLSFPPLTNLAELFIGINSFTTLERSAFEKLKKLTTLNLNGAQLHNISIGAFVGLESLRILDLSSNRLNRVPTKELSSLNRLEELSIGMNDFDIISEKAFDGLTNLHKLEIIGAKKLTRIQNNAFIENGNLRTIRLTDNEELSQFESAAFHGLPYLKELILKNNAIESIRENLYEWDNLDALDLSDNPLRCDCHLLWYKAFLSVHASKSKNINLNKINNNNNNHYRHINNHSINSSSSSNNTINNSVNSAKIINEVGDNDLDGDGDYRQHNIVCASPQYAKGKELIKLSSDSFGCTPNSDPKTQAIICGLLVITAATITALILLAYKCRRRKFRNVLKDSGWDISSTIGRKDRDYHKTYSAAPQYIDTMRKHTMSASPSHCNMPGANNYQQYPMIPITEL
jgi:Leucine-rich repeat (LRR) protein